MSPFSADHELHQSVHQVILDGEPLYVLRATSSDIGTIQAMISDARKRLKTLGTDQWATDWRDDQGRNRDDRVQHSVYARKTWLAVVILPGRTVPVATVTIDQSPNPSVWPEPDLAAEPAVYLNRAVTAQGFSGLYIGTALIDWVAQWGNRNGARYVRIDVWTTNSGLHTYTRSGGLSPAASSLTRVTHLGPGISYRRPISTDSGRKSWRSPLPRASHPERWREWR